MSFLIDMAVDPLARRVVLNYEGGAASMTRGLADALFGPTWRLGLNTPASKTVSVKAHSRVRVIGGPSKAVSGYSYTLKSWPTMDSGGAVGGQAVKIRLASGDSWTVRVSGTMADFCEWLRKGLISTNVNVITERGTIYGPFGTGTTP